MSKRDFSTILTTIAGQPIKAGISTEALGRSIGRIQKLLSPELLEESAKIIAEETGKPLTLSSIAVEALQAQFDDERQLSGDDKLKRWKLAVKVHGAAEPVELSAEDIALIKRLVGKAYSAAVVGPAFLALESEPVTS